MNTHKICFHGEIRKIAVLLSGEKKKHLNWSYDEYLEKTWLSFMFVYYSKEGTTPSVLADCLSTYSSGMFINII